MAIDITVNSFDFDEITIRDQNGNVETFDLKEELKINEFDLSNEMYQQPQKYVYFTSLLEKVRAYQESSELVLEKIHADLYEPSRQALFEQLDKNPTKDQIESAIMQNEQYLQQREAVNTYTSMVKHLQYVVKAFEQRKDMLIQIAADQRKQAEYENSIKDRHMNTGWEAKT